MLSLCDLWCYNVKNVELVQLSALVRAFIHVKGMSYQDYLDMLETAKSYVSVPVASVPIL